MQVKKALSNENCFINICFFMQVTIGASINNIHLRVLQNQQLNSCWEFLSNRRNIEIGWMCTFLKIGLVSPHPTTYSRPFTRFMTLCNTSIAQIQVWTQCGEFISPSLYLRICYVQLFNVTLWVFGQQFSFVGYDGQMLMSLLKLNQIKSNQVRHDYLVLGRK